MFDIVDLTWTNLFYIGVGGAISLAVVIGSEILNRNDKIHDEIARKSSHFGLGLLLFVWLTWHGYEMYVTMLLLATAATVVLWPLHIFRAMRDVRRKTIGHLLYPLGLLLVAAIFDDVVTNQVALLHLFVVDTAAALVGKQFNSKIILKFAGSQKTVFGSLAFWVGSATVLAVLVRPNTTLDTLGVLLFVTAAANIMTAAEMFGFYGSDNLYLPLLSAALYSGVV